MVALMHHAGVPFLAGTDTPPGVYVFPGFSLHDELQIFVNAGFTPLEALQTATLNPAVFLGLERELGHGRGRQDRGPAPAERESTREHREYEEDLRSGAARPFLFPSRHRSDAGGRGGGGEQIVSRL